MKSFLIIALISAVSASVSAKPKYGPEGKPVATPLHADATYFRELGRAAPDFWNMIGFYVPQQNSYSCSAASVTMALNAALVTRKKTSDDENIVQAKLLAAVRVENWEARVNEGGYKGDFGTNLEVLGKVTQAAFEKYLKNVKVTVRHADATPAFRAEVIKVLTENENSGSNLLLANFDQFVFTNDSHAGHIAPVAAYDSARQRVLVMDPDREFYEPYWVSLDTFIAGMNTTDTGAKAQRGYVFISFAAP